jgi:uncharacterized membrane protein HdeD (DUF308 family)
VGTTAGRKPAIDPVIALSNSDTVTGWFWRLSGEASLVQVLVASRKTWKMLVSLVVSKPFRTA